jgi:membrane protein insertase Oxa1/YidC/SpoIIIJ
MFYKVVILPAVWLISFIYFHLYSLTGNYGISLLCLSIVSSILILLFSKLFEPLVNREAEIQNIMAPQIQRIKRESKGEMRHRRISNLYQRYQYHPILAFRSAIHLIIQLPFLIGAYFMLSHLLALHGVSFLFFKDLSLPDGLLFGINLLPILMTVVNISTSFISPDFHLRERIQAICIAIFFFALLYSAASALLIFWTMNNLIFLGRTLIKRYYKQKIQETKNYNVLTQHQLMVKAVQFARPYQLVTLLTIYFSFLVLFYLYQYSVFTAEMVVRRLTKSIPLFLASFSLWLLIIKGFIHDYIPTLKMNLVVAFNSISLALFFFLFVNNRLQLFPFDYHLSKLLVFCSILLIMNSLVVVILDHKPLKGKEFLSNYTIYFLLLLFTLIPTLHLANVNADYLQGINYLYYFAIFIVFAFINYYWGLLFSFGRMNRSQVAIHASIFSFLFIMLPVIRNLIAYSSGNDIDFWIFFCILVIAASFTYKHRIVRKLMTFAVILFVVVLANIMINLVLHPKAERLHRTPIPKALQHIQFQEKPNIYLFLYDGMPNQRVFKQDKLPFAPLDSLLKSHHFKLYDDTYSLGNSSIISMALTLNITDHINPREDIRDIYSGNSVANQVLRSQGYKTHLLLEDYFTGAYSASDRLLVDEFFPPRKAWGVNTNFFFTLIKGILRGEFKFDTQGLTNLGGYTAEDREKRKEQLIMANGQGNFVIDHYEYPCHSANSEKVLPIETTLWIERYMIAIQQMKKDMDDIEKYDPNAIMIAMGDHGPMLNSGGTDMKSLKKKDITPDLIWDKLGSMVAIRWPDAKKASLYDNDIKVNQDIFAVIFSYLSNDPQYLKLKPKRVFSGYKTLTRSKIHFKEGVILP